MNSGDSLRNIYLCLNSQKGMELRRESRGSYINQRAKQSTNTNDFESKLSTPFYASGKTQTEQHEIKPI